MHIKVNKNISKYTKTLADVLRSNVPLSKWFLELLVRDTIYLKHGLIECMTLSSFYFSTLVNAAVDTVSRYERDIYNELTDVDLYDANRILHHRNKSYECETYLDKHLPIHYHELSLKPKSTVIYLIETMMELHISIENRGRDFYYYWYVIYNFLLSGPEERLYAVNRNFFACLMDAYLGDDSPEFEGSKKRMRYKRTSYEQTRLNSLTYILGSISVLIVNGSPYNTIEHYEYLLSDQDFATLTSDVFLKRVASDCVNPEAVGNIFNYVSSIDVKHGQYMINIAGNTLLGSLDDVLPMLKVIPHFFNDMPELSISQSELVGAIVKTLNNEYRKHNVALAIMNCLVGLKDKITHILFDYFEELDIYRDYDNTAIASAAEELCTHLEACQPQVDLVEEEEVIYIDSSDDSDDYELQEVEEVVIQEATYEYNEEV